MPIANDLVFAVVLSVIAWRSASNTWVAFLHVGTGNLKLQTKQVYENIKSALETVGLDFHDVVKLTFFLTDISKMQIVILGMSS